MKKMKVIGVLCIAATTCLTGCWFGSDSDKDKKNVKASAQKQVQVNLKQDYMNAEALISYIKNKKDQTELQRSEGFKKLKGKTVVFKGEVRNVGTTMFGGKTYVSLKVGSLNMFENINIQFNVPESLKTTVGSWARGEIRILRGTIKGQGDMEDDAVCENASVVDSAKYDEIVGASVSNARQNAQIPAAENVASKAESAFGSLKKMASSISNSEVKNVEVNKDDVKAAIKVWQGSRWKNDEIIAARNKNGKVRTEDLAVKCNLEEMQPIADLLVADYIMAVNLLDAFQATPNEAEAVKALVSAISLEDVAKMMADAAKVTLSLKDLKEKAQNNKWKFMKDSYLITSMSSSMSGGFKIVKEILEKELGK